MRNRILITVAGLALALLGLAYWSLRGGTPAGDIAVSAAAEPDEPAPGIATAKREAAPARERVAEDSPPIGAAASDAGPAPEELWGRVVAAATGAPVAGAELRLLHRDADEFRNLDLEYGERIEQLAEGVSDRDGRFRFDVRRARHHRLQARAAGYAPATLIDCTGGSEVVVELAAGATIEGVVLCGGAGVPGVDVLVSVAGESIELGQARSGLGGAFRCEDLQPTTVTVTARSPSHPEVGNRVMLEPGATHRLQIELRVGALVQGRVFEAGNGVGIVGAWVSDSWTFERSVRSGADGRFELAGVQDDGFGALYARASGYASSIRNLAGAASDPIEIPLVRGGELTGRFVTTDRGPVHGLYAAAGASYSVRSGIQDTDWVRLDVDRDGRFVARGLRPDLHYWIYVRGSRVGSRVYALPGRLADHDRIDVGEILLHLAGGVEGRVTNDAGEPLAAIEVSIRGANRDRLALLPSAAETPLPVSQFESHAFATDRDGRFRCGGLSAGRYRVSVRPPGHEREFATEVELDDGVIREGLEIVVPAGSVIAGILRYADARNPAFDAGRVFLSAMRDSGAGSFTATIERDGRFRFAGLAEGTYTITLPFGPKGWSLAPQQVAAGTNDLVLLLQPSACVTGRVVGPDGRGRQARVFARAEGDHGGVPLHPTEADGTFRIEVPHGFLGAVGVMGLGPGLRGTQVGRVSAGQSDVILTLRER
jgi:hypothetical protein